MPAINEVDVSEIVEQYMGGECHVFAIAATRRFGLGLAILSEVGDGGETRPVHVMAYDRRSDRFLDVRGWHSREGVLEDALNRWVLEEPVIDDQCDEEEIRRYSEDEDLWPFNEADVSKALSDMALLGERVHVGPRVPNGGVIGSCS